MPGERDNVPFQLRALFFMTIGACAVAWVVRLILAEPQLGLTWLIFAGMYTSLPIGSLILWRSCYIVAVTRERDKPNEQLDRLQFRFVRLNLFLAWFIAIPFLLAALLFPFEMAFKTVLDFPMHPAANVVNLLIAILIGAFFAWVAINAVSNARKNCEKWSRLRR